MPKFLTKATMKLRRLATARLSFPLASALANAFWNSPRTWTDIFTTNGSTPIANSAAQHFILEREMKPQMDADEH